MGQKGMHFSYKRIKIKDPDPGSNKRTSISQKKRFKQKHQDLLVQYCYVVEIGKNMIEENNIGE